jgi:hypothetical protein
MLLRDEAPHVQQAVINKYFKNFVVPESSEIEGVDEIIEVAFVPHFNNEKEKYLFYLR